MLGVTTTRTHLPGTPGGVWTPVPLAETFSTTDSAGRPAGGGQGHRAATSPRAYAHTWGELNLPLTLVAHGMTGVIFRTNTHTKIGFLSSF